ncbi:MAG: ABC transporter permease [Puniceicoccaceae bacterium]|nr:MAG: ABC transporter permease [Puniceicoccaceae bacterium]
MDATLALFKREFFGYFRSPVAYVFLIVFLLAAVGLAFFVGQFFRGNTASLDAFFVFHPWLFLFFIPAVGMRLWAEEKRSGTIEILFTLPLTPLQAVAGKFFAGWLFVALAVVLTFPMALTVGYLGSPDWGMILCSYLGSILMAGAYLSICSLTSSLTKNQVISFVLSTLVCLVLVFLGWGVFSNLLGAVFPVWLVDLLATFSFTTHYESMMRGLLDLRGLVYFLSLMAFSLFLNVLALER